MARFARFYNISYTEMLKMPYSVFIGLVTEIEIIKAEEALLQLAIANDPKPVYDIDTRKTGKSSLERLQKELQSRLGKAEKENKLDKAGLEILKRKMSNTQSLKKRY